ncbi:MAG: hypothetical protein HC793_00130 [Aquincola sp.]|nr:hypothetical protein [Aquincola sp.]
MPVIIQPDMTKIDESTEFKYPVHPDPVLDQQPLPTLTKGSRGTTRAAKLKLRAQLQRENEVGAERAGRAAQYAGMVRDENQLDMFDQPPLAADEPTAEPLGDIQAQIEDLKDPDSPRKGVYLSAANIENLRRIGGFEQVRGAGVPLANFDGKGGTLIAKDRAAADELIALRDENAGDMQEVLGLATGSGSGKPAGAQIVVQQRDLDGNVTRESLVATDQEADTLAAQWEQEPDRETRILSSAAALRRREQRIRDDRRGLEQTRETRKVVRSATDIIDEELGDSPEAQSARTVIGNKPLSENQAARRLLKYAQAREERVRKRRIEGLDDPRERDFGSPEKNARYRELFVEYLTQLQVQDNAQVAEDTLKARAKAQTLREQLITFLKLNKSDTAATRVARAAQRISPEESAKIRRASPATKRADTPESVIDEMPEMSRGEVRGLSGTELDVAFTRAANYLSGLRAARTEIEDKQLPQAGMREYMPVGKTFEELVAKYSTESERKKLVLRAQRVKRMRRFQR